MNAPATAHSNVKRLSCRASTSETAIGVIVDGATCGTHEHGSRHEDHENQRLRLTAAGDPQSPQGWPKQKPNADGPVEAGEADIVMNRADDFRQLIGGPGMKADAIGIPPQPRHDHLRQFIAVAWQWHARIA
jgi:hypothetical protein